MRNQTITAVLLAGMSWLVGSPQLAIAAQDAGDAAVESLVHVQRLPDGGLQPEAATPMGCYTCSTSAVTRKRATSSTGGAALVSMPTLATGLKPCASTRHPVAQSPSAPCEAVIWPWERAASTWPGCRPTVRLQA